MWGQDNPSVFAAPESYLSSSVLINKFNSALLGKTRIKKKKNGALLMLYDKLLLSASPQDSSRH